MGLSRWITYLSHLFHRCVRLISCVSYIIYLNLREDKEFPFVHCPHVKKLPFYCSKIRVQIVPRKCTRSHGSEGSTPAILHPFVCSAALSSEVRDNIRAARTFEKSVCLRVESACVDNEAALRRRLEHQQTRRTARPPDELELGHC